EQRAIALCSEYIFFSAFSVRRLRGNSIHNHTSRNTSNARNTSSRRFSWVSRSCPYNQEPGGRIAGRTRDELSTMDMPNNNTLAVARYSANQSRRVNDRSNLGRETMRRGLERGVAGPSLRAGPIFELRVGRSGSGREFSGANNFNESMAAPA